MSSWHGEHLSTGAPLLYVSAFVSAVYLKLLIIIMLTCYKQFITYEVQVRLCIVICTSLLGIITLNLTNSFNTYDVTEDETTAILM